MADTGVGIPIPVPAPPSAPIGIQPSDTQPLPRIAVPAPPAPAPPEKPAGAPEPTPEPSPPEIDTGSAPTLDKLALILLIIALILIAKYFTDFLNWLLANTIDRIPGIKSSPKLNHQAVTQALGSYLGAAATTIDPEVGTNFTQMGQTVGRASQAYVSLATRILKTATGLAVVSAAVVGSQTSQNALRHEVQRQGADTAKTAHQLEAQAKQQAAADTGIQARIDQLTHHVTHVLEPELDGLRHAIPELQKGATDTWKVLESHGTALGLEAMVGTVAVAMGTLGAGWTRCDTNRDIGEALCGSNGNTVRNLLHDLMPLIDIALLCSFIKAISAMGKNPVLLDALGVFSIGVEDLLRCTGASLPTPLSLPALSLGPPQAWATLAPVNV